MTDRPFSAETAAAVQRYLGAFLSGAPARDAMHDVVTDVQYWGDSDHLEVLRITHGVIGVRARVAEDVEFLTLVEDIGLRVEQALLVMELDEPPAGTEDLLSSDPDPEPEAAEPRPEGETPTADTPPAAAQDSPAPRLVSIDTAIDDEVVLVEKAQLPRPTEKEGLRSRRERRRLASQEAEEHERRAQEAQEAERLARSRSSAPQTSGDVKVVHGADPASGPGRPHVRVTDGTGPRPDDVTVATEVAETSDDPSVPATETVQEPEQETEVAAATDQQVDDVSEAVAGATLEPSADDPDLDDLDSDDSDLDDSDLDDSDLDDPDPDVSDPDVSDGAVADGMTEAEADSASEAEHDRPTDGPDHAEDVLFARSDPARAASAERTTDPTDVGADTDVRPVTNDEDADLEPAPLGMWAILLAVAAAATVTLAVLLLFLG